MSAIAKFASDVIDANTALINAVTKCRELKDRFDSDANIASTALASSGVRPDLSAADWENLLSTSTGGWFQMVFAFDAGTPSQKAKMFKAL